MLKQSFLDWNDENGFYVKNVWDLLEGKWVGKGLMQWFPWQRRILRHMFTPDRDGILPYSVYVWSQPKKSGKSIIGSAVGAWVAESAPDHSEIYPVANDQEQASRLFEDIVYHAQHMGLARATRKELTYANDTKVIPLAQSYASAAGTRHILSLFDELWAVTKESSRRMYVELTPPPTIPSAFRLIVTYAGFENESELLWDLYDKNWANGEVIPELADIVNTRGDPVCKRNGSTFIFWDDQHRMPWQTDKYYSSQKESMRAADYLRIHCNQWVSSKTSFIDIEQVESRVTLDGPLALEPDPNIRRLPVWLGVDVGYKHDCCAVIAVAWDERTGRPRLADHRIFYPEDSAKIFDIDETVSKTIIDWNHLYNMQAAYYDPFQFHQPAVNLRKMGLNLIEFSQTAGNMTMATQALFEVLNTGKIDLYEAPTLFEHLKYAPTVTTSRGMRLMKARNAKYKIDAAVALAIATYAAIQGSYGRRYTEPLVLPEWFSDVTYSKRSTDPNWLPDQLRN